MMLVNSCLELFSSFWNCSPGALKRYEFLFNEKFVKCM